MVETINENSQDQDKDGEVELRRSKNSFSSDFMTYVLEGEPQTLKKVVSST